MSASAAPLESFALYDRDHELAVLTDLVSRARSGDGGLVVLAGPAGIGKTSLLQAGVEQARAGGLTTLVARGAELEEAFAFGVARQLFEPVAERDGVLEGQAHLAAPLMGMAPPDGTSSPALVHGLFWLACNLAASDPLLIAVDDAQWADAHSLRFLAYLARRLDGLPIGLVVASRSDPADPSLTTELASRDGAPGRALELGPLSRDGVARTVRDALGPVADAAFCAACHQATAGNPFFLHELLMRAEAQGLAPDAAHAGQLGTLESPAVARSIRARLATLGDDAAALARATALLDTDVELRHAAALAGLDAERAAAAADALGGATILAPARPLRFVHPLVQASVYAEIPLGERALMHAHAASMLAAEDADSARIAAHLLAAEPAGDARVVGLLRAAAREATARGAADIAATYLERALAEPPDAEQRAGVLLELGRAQASTGDTGGFQHIAAALEDTSDPVERAEVAVDLGRGLMLDDRLPEAIELLERARADLGDRAPALADWLAAESIGAELLDVATASGALQRLRRSIGAQAADSTGRRVLLAYGAFAVVAAGASPSAAVTAAERALAGGGLAAEATVIPLCFGASALAFADRCEAALAALGSGLDAARRTGSSVTFAVCSWMASHVEYRRGALSAAEAYARDSLEPTVEAWFPAGVAFLADALVERGRLDEAEAAYRAHGLDRSHNRDFLVSNLMLASRGRLRHAQGRAGEALEDLHECGERLVAAGITNPAIVPWRSAAALAHLDAEDVGAARELAADELALAEGFGSPRGVGIALRAAGLVEERAGARDEALARLEQGAALLEGCGAPLEHARALVDLGATRRRAGQRADARDQLRRGLDLASACGATVLAQRARTELVAAGAKPRRERTTGADALTASERRVAEMAAEGMTNRQIAEALFVTQHTIAKHLTHAYEKLGIKQRTELAAALS